MKKFLQFLILLFLVFTISGCFKTKSPAVNNQIGSKALTQEELETQYESALKEILKPYWVDNSVAGLKDKVLALTVPVEYLDLHFNLVIAIELIEQGSQTSDQAKIEDGLEKIAELKNEYDWLD